ncbi:MAG: SpoIIE family protein phosphatase, partial [Alphaproteobacteria bacterium]|nr:SpoIIE family protein phosphatase [Alphaproteobacteria bacterium]
RGIIGPVRQMIDSIDRLAANDLAPEVPMAGRPDELGDVARALVVFRKNAIERERLQKQERDDLEFARHIQLTSVPSAFPAFPERREFDVCGHLSPMRSIGGDFFDFYFIDDRRLALVIGDASGKGVPSALFVSAARGILKAATLKGADPSHCLAETNSNVAAGNDSLMFITAFLAVLDTTTGTLSYANAGHLPPYLLRDDGTVRALAVESGLPLGVVDQFAFRMEHMRLAPGDALVLYTDGVTEATAPDGELFGDQRLADLLGADRWRNCHEIVEGVMGGVRLYEAGAPQSDDVAVLALRYLG